MKIICILFHIGKNKNELSYDSKLRLLAGFELAKEYRDALVLFVGGGGLKVSGSRLMKEYWKVEFSTLNNQIFSLEKSNNSCGNVEEIKSFIINKFIKNPEIIIISNQYHTKRLKQIFKQSNLDVKIVASEEVLLEKDNDKDIKAYLNSFGYKKKLMLELILRAYSAIDPNQRLVQLWRQFSYHG